jgi:hypothetical protein
VSACLLACGIQHVKRMRRFMLSSVGCLSGWLYHIFVRYLVNVHDSRKKATEDKMCVLVVSAAFV